MIEGIVEAAGMTLALAGWFIHAHKAEVISAVAELRSKIASKPGRHRRIRGKHRFDASKPWESATIRKARGDDVAPVQAQTTQATPASTLGAGSVDPGLRVRPVASSRMEPRGERTDRPPRIPAGQARQRFARAATQAAPTGWVTLR